MGKRAALAKLVQDIRASYWFLPTILAVLAVVLAQITLAIDLNTDRSWLVLPPSWTTTQVDGARSTLSVVASAIIGVTGVMFSMTLVAVSFASGNFGPRLIGNFMRDRGNQWSLGILIATFVYALLVLRAVQSDYGVAPDAVAFVPHLSMFVALGLTGVSIMAMIYYVHHIPETINVSNITAGLGRKLSAALKTQIDVAAYDRDEDPVDFPEREPDRAIFLAQCGYIQTWNKTHLQKLARDHDLFLWIDRGAGAFVSEVTPVVSIWSDGDIEEDVEQAMRECFALGAVPTEPQNLLFFVEQLVEMMARALSPGVNDPYTAINALNWLYVGLSTASGYKGGLQPRPGGRVRSAALDLPVLLERSVDDAMPYVADDPLACRHLLAMLDCLIRETEDPAFRRHFEETRAKCQNRMNVA